MQLDMEWEGVKLESAGSDGKSKAAQWETQFVTDKTRLQVDEHSHDSNLKSLQTQSHIPSLFSPCSTVISWWSWR